LFFSGISRGPCDNLHYLNHVKDVEDDDDDDDYDDESEILVENRNFFISRLNSTLPLVGLVRNYCHKVWCGKTRMVDLPDVIEKFQKVFTYTIHERDRQTDRQTPHDGISRAYV